MTDTIQKLLLGMAFAGFMGASFGAALGLALTQVVDKTAQSADGEGETANAQ